MTVLATILKLTRQLYPKGEAFNMPVGGWLEALHKGLALSEAQLHQDTLAVLNSLLPDNANFTAEDATLWEQRLGIINNPNTLLADRKKAIARKMGAPGPIPAQQNWRYVQLQLQRAGFDVYVYENRFLNAVSGLYESKPPNVVFGTAATSNVQFGNTQFGQNQFGGTWRDKIVNSLDPEVDRTFVVTSNFNSTFFISGSTVTTPAVVPLVRQTEFRQLVLRLKPAQMVAFPNIIYTL